MPLFGRKKKEKKREVREAEELVKSLEKEEREKKLKMPEAKKPERPEFAPLFVRLNRYKQILHEMNYLKTTMGMVKNSLSILNELDRLRKDNLKIIQEAVGKVEKRLLTLDSEFMRPSGFTERVPEIRDVESLEVTMADLRREIDRLKGELEQIA